jgi:hypothetical protein
MAAFPREGIMSHYTVNEGSQHVIQYKPRPNHILHFLLTIVSCGFWANVWIALTARYWNVSDYHDPREKQGMDRRTWIAIVVLGTVQIVAWILVISMGVFAANTVNTAIEEAATGVTNTAQIQELAEAPVVKAPKGVTVSGDYSQSLQVRSFKPGRDAFDWFEVDLRVKNLTDEDFSGVLIKVVALRGEEVIATANGLIMSIDAGQTITTNVSGGDDFPASRKGITYELEME